MSFQAMTWAVQQKVGNATGKAILLMLANYADDQGECFPSQEKLAAECECSVATVARWLKAFEEWGALVKVKQYGEGGYRRADRLQLAIGIPITKLPSTELPNSASKLTHHSDGAEPVKEPTSLRSVSSGARDLAEFRQALGTILPSPLIETLIQSRRKKRAAINGHAGSLLVKALGRCPDPVAAAEEMAVRGWTSVKPEWLERSQVRGSPPPKPSLANGFMDLAQQMGRQDAIRSEGGGRGVRPALPDLSAVSGG